MKHASLSTLDRFSELLDALRSFAPLREPKPGIFYLGRSAFLHFHEDRAGLFADVKRDGKSFSRFDVSNAVDQRRLLDAVEATLQNRGGRGGSG